MASYIIEGLDRLGKSSLIQGIIKKQGYHHVIHYSKPIHSDLYDQNLFDYQEDSFCLGFKLLEDSFQYYIFDRFHIGENVYAKRYRGYSGEYVFDLEKIYGADKLDHVNLILLIASDLSFQKDDGESFDWTKRQEEQNDFIESVNRSIFKNKKIIDVCNGNGGYRSYNDILNEALDGGKHE